MKSKQLIILSLAFVLPIMIFIFLKTLGKNEFAVEPLYQLGAINVSVDCGVEYKTPYTVSQRVLEDLYWSEQDSLTLYVFDVLQFDEAAVTTKLKETYSGEELELHKVISDSLSIGKGQDMNPILRDAVTIEQLMDCFFIMEKGKNAVLVDKLKRIRGHYDLSKREEIDRLAVEVKIMLKKY